MQKLIPLPEFSFLDSIFCYDPETGKLFWKNRPEQTFRDPKRAKAWNSAYASKEAGSLDKDGYRQVVINYKSYKVHRIVWKLQHQEDCYCGLDHKDGDKSNNRLDNLRKSTQSENNYNVGKQKNNTTGLKGVTFIKTRNKYAAQIRVDKKHINLGRFDTAEQAHEAYKTAAVKHHREFANYGR